ncbi:hypothetical protein Ahy_B06g083665 isoform B [Arachis hypogaea]|uniref:HHH domain-containing protein n=1 Tax=Arachis hypogaea TaxID=3818 RepID=A0A444YQB6_ARAHY|nr:hypothetical protein Ahy_B06g083665 isoform B [Arachis hypogaea]
MREKPLSKFEDAQWLLIQKAEEEKLLQVTIKLPEEYLNKLIDQFNEYYISDSVSRFAQLWNEQRKLILNDAIFRFLLPSMEKEARGVLSSKAKNWLLMEYGEALWNKVSVGPYQQKENDLSSDEEAAPRVIACCWGPGKPQTTSVMLDSSGEVLDVIFKMVEENPRDVGHEMDHGWAQHCLVFLRVRRSGLAASSSQFIDLLDDTRIHPESYSLAIELAKDVYEEDGTADTNNDDDAEMAIEHTTDDWRDVVELSDRLLEGDILTCKIKSIQKNRYQVFLVCIESEMRSNRFQNNRDLDPYYHEDRSSLQSDQDKGQKEKELAKKHFKPRLIVHPRFQNITADEAM